MAKQPKNRINKKQPDKKPNFKNLQDFLGPNCNSIDSLVMDCEAGKCSQIKEYQGIKYCPLLVSLYKSLCQYLSKEQVRVIMSSGNHEITKYYSKCNNTKYENKK